MNTTATKVCLGLIRGRFWANNMPRLASWAVALGVLTLCTGINTIQAATFMIDDFSDPASGNAHTSRSQNAWYDTTATVLGGIRDGSVGCELWESDGLTTAQITDGELNVTTNKKASPSVYFSYDQTPGWGSHLDTNPFNGVLNPVADFTNGGTNDQFAFTFTHADGRNISTPFFNDFLITVKIQGDTELHFYNGGNGDQGTQGTNAANVWMEANYNDLNAGTPATYTVPFSALSGTVDMEKIEGFALHICSNNYNLDYTMDSLATVPEPTAMGLLALGGIAMLRRRKH